jgi:hypothetical protein
MHFMGGLAIKVDPVTDVSQEKSDQHHTQWENSTAKIQFGTF